MTCIYTVMILNDPSMSQLHRQDAAPGWRSAPSVVLSDVSGTWVRRLQKYFWGQRVYKNQPVQAKPTNKALGPIGDTESPWKHIEKNHGKTELLEAVFFPFNLFHKNCTSVHFWWAGQDLVVLSTLERPQHQAFSCLPKKSPTPSIPVGKSQLWTCPHPLPAQPSQQPGPQQSEIF